MTDTPILPARAAAQMAPWWWPRMKDVLAVLSTAIFLLTMLAPKFGFTVDQDLKGAIMIQWGGVMGYYFGTSQASAKKDDTINTMAEKQ